MPQPINTEVFEDEFDSTAGTSQSVFLGKDGDSAYKIAVQHGYVGTEEEWLASLQGADGKSAYEAATEAGYSKTEEEFNKALSQVVEPCAVTTFYVDSVNGSDDNDGFTLETAFKTIAQVIKYQALTLPRRNYLSTTVMLADGEYTISTFFRSVITASTGSMMRFTGISGNAENVILYLGASATSIIGWSQFVLENLTLASPNNQSLSVASVGAFFIVNVVWRLQVWFYHTRVIIQTRLKIAQYTNGINVHGRILADANSNITFANGCEHVIDQYSKNKHIYTAQSGGYFYFAQTSLSSFKVEDGESADFTGIFMRIYAGGFCQFQNAPSGIIPKNFYPNCTTSSAIGLAYAVGDDVNYQSNTSPLMQPHSYALNRDEADCHPVEAITGLKAILDDYEARLTAMERVVKIPLYLLPLGYNLKGATVYFTNQDKPSIANPTSLTNVLLVNGTETSAKGIKAVLGAIIAVGLASDTGGNTAIKNVNGWVETQFTFPSNIDYIVTQNGLQPHTTDSDWGFDYAYIIK